MKVRTQVPLLLLAFSLASAPWAPSEAGALSVTPGAGIVFYQANGGEGEAVIAGLKSDYTLQSGDLPGVWGVECAFSAATLSTAIADNDKTFTFRIGPLWAGPPLWGVTSLVSAGFGMLYGNSNPGTKTSVNPYISFGIGARYPVSERFALRFDVHRFQTLDVSVARGYELTAGLSYAFGRGGWEGSAAPRSAATGGEKP